MNKREYKLLDQIRLEYRKQRGLWFKLDPVAGQAEMGRAQSRSDFLRELLEMIQGDLLSAKLLELRKQTKQIESQVQNKYSGKWKV